MRRTLVCLLVFVAVTATSGQNKTFRLTKSQLDVSEIKLPLLEVWLRFDKSTLEKLSNIPTDLSNIEYTSIKMSSVKDNLITGLRGYDNRGNVIYLFDQNNDEDFSNDSPITFHKEGALDIARIPIFYDSNFDGKTVERKTTLSIFRRKKGKLEYHLDELWKTKLIFKDEAVPIAFQRFPGSNPLVFLDTDLVGNYKKPLFINKQVLGLGGAFFKLEIDFHRETATLVKTDRQPIDRGFPAPKFAAKFWNTNKTFRMSEHNEKITVLTFWSPSCPGSRSEVKLYNGLKSQFQTNQSIDFISVVTDSKKLASFLNAKNKHSFKHIANKNLWNLFGVTAPFVTFIIDQKGIIVSRFFRFSGKIPLELKKTQRK